MLQNWDICDNTGFLILFYSFQVVSRKQETQFTMRSEMPVHGLRCQRLLNISFLHQECIIQRDDFTIGTDKEEEVHADAQSLDFDGISSANKYCHSPAAQQIAFASYYSHGLLRSCWSERWIYLYSHTGGEYSCVILSCPNTQNKEIQNGHKSNLEVFIELVGSCSSRNGCLPSTSCTTQLAIPRPKPRIKRGTRSLKNTAQRRRWHGKVWGRSSCPKVKERGEQCQCLLLSGLKRC